MSVQVRQRFQQIYQTFKRDPSANLQNMKYSEDAGIAKKRQDQIFDKLSSCYAEWRQELAGKEKSPSVAVGRFSFSYKIHLTTISSSLIASSIVLIVLI